MRPGDRAERTRRFTQADADALLALGGAAAAPGCVPEVLIAALFSQLLGVDLPGPGANYIKQETDYLAPVPLGQPLTASVEVVRIRGDKSLVDLETLCRDASGALVARGRAVVLVADVGKG